MIINNKKKKTIYILSALFLAPVIVFLVVVLVLIISSNIFYYKHKPVYLRQTICAFKTNNESIVFSSELDPEHSCYKYSEISEYFYDDYILEGRESFKIIKAYGNENIIVYLFKTSEGKCFFELYDKDLALLQRIDFEENKYVFDFDCYNNLLYCVVRDKTDGSINVERINIVDNLHALLFSDVEGKFSFNDNGLVISVDVSYSRVPWHCISIQKPKTKLLRTYNDGFAHRWFGNYDIVVRENSVEAKINDRCLTLQIDNHQELYLNAFLIDNKIIFATYTEKKNNECGNKPDSNTCICQIDQSYLYCLDLEDNRLYLKESFDSGSFLIDYDEKNVWYYNNGFVYKNSILIRQTKKIETGELQKLKGSPYFESGDNAEVYYLSQFEDTIYGV